MGDGGDKVVTRIQPVGWLLAIFGFIFPFTLGYILIDGVLLVVALVSVLALAIGRIMGRWNVKKCEVQADMPTRAYAGKGFETKLYLDNKKAWLDSFGISVACQIMHNIHLEGTANWVSSGDGALMVQRTSIPRRGSILEMKIELKSLFPLGLFSHSLTFKQPHSFIVYPKLILPLELLAYGSLNDINPQQGFQNGESLGELKGIREWQTGDSVKKIHWPATANSFLRGQGLRVREFDPPGFSPSNSLVVFHSHAVFGEVYRHDRFERACSLVAGTLHHLRNIQVMAYFTADFLGWKVMECNSRSQYIELLAILAQANRSLDTDQNSLQSILDYHSTDHDQVIIISDVDPDAWSDQMDLPSNTLVIDIRQIRYARRTLSKVK